MENVGITCEHGVESKVFMTSQRFPYVQKFMHKCHNVRYLTYKSYILLTL